MRILTERRLGVLLARILVASSFLLLLVVQPVMAASGQPRTAALLLAQEEVPYEPPEISLSTPRWLRPFGALAELPVWAQAAVVAAAIAALVVVVPIVIRFVWRTVSRGGFSDESYTDESRP
jgi:hypothetical protein